MNNSTTRTTRLLASLTLAALVLLAPGVVSHAQVERQTAGCSGYYYTVEPGDTWSIISRRVGVTVYRLKQLNPQAVRSSNWVLIGEQLCVPAGAGTPVAATATPVAGATPQAGATAAATRLAGYWYQIEQGDTWNTVATASDIPVAELWAANPDSQNALQWLYVGQRLWIPGPETATPTPSATAFPTSTATATAAATATATATATAAATATSTATATATAAATATITPTLPATATATAAATITPTLPATATATAAATHTPTLTATATATATSVAAATAAAATAPVEAARVTASPVPTVMALLSPLATPTPAPVVQAAPPPAATAQPLPPIPEDCPASLEEYGDAVLAYLNVTDNTPETLQNWLVACRAVAPDSQGVAVVPIPAAGPAAKSEAVIVTVAVPATASQDARGRLFVLHKGDAGYSLAHQVEGAGRIALLKAADINADKQFDLAYSDTICGVHTCFGTLYVISWNGKEYVTWIEGEPTIAGPEVTFEDVSADGEGDEIVVHGGVIGSVGAGPQRAWTETYYSPKGAAYKLLLQIYDTSDCLYHKILDANAAFDRWALGGFGEAIELYAVALEAEDPEACGTIKDEVATLQDFARFRMMVSAVASGSPGDATTVVKDIKQPGLRAAANAFLVSFSASKSVIQACRDATKVAEANPEAWQFLADWGYANPSFTAKDLCPLN